MIRVQQEKTSVTKKDPHLGKKKYYYYFFSFSFSLIYWDKGMKLFFSNSKCLITEIQCIGNEVKKYKKIWSARGYFLVTHFLFYFILLFYLKEEE